MAQIVVSEYISIDRNSRVLRDEKTNIYIVECFIESAVTRREIFKNINSAEDYAEDWIQCH